MGPSKPPNTIVGEISDIWFPQLLVGTPDFTLGGGRYVQALKSLKLGSRRNRNVPVEMEILTRINATRNEDNPRSVGAVCASMMEFFLLLRVSDLECMWRMGASLPFDTDGNASLRLEIHLAETDRHIDGAFGSSQGGQSPAIPGARVRPAGRNATS